MSQIGWCVVFASGLVVLESFSCSSSMKNTTVGSEKCG